MRAERKLLEEAREGLAACVDNDHFSIRHLINYLLSVTKVEVLAKQFSKIGFNLHIFRNLIAENKHRAVATNLHKIC